MGADRETVSLYDAKAAEYLDTFQTDAPSPRLLDFISSLPTGGSVLDLGCGPGNAAAVMRDHGLQVTAMDASAEMARIAKQLFDLDVQLGTFDDITGTAIYDGIWANFSLLHAQEELADLLTTAGFSIDRIETGEEAGLAGPVEPWIIVTADA
jgi:trans-aconitate methyltransferase